MRRTQPNTMGPNVLNYPFSLNMMVFVKWLTTATTVAEVQFVFLISDPSAIIWSEAHP